MQFIHQPLTWGFLLVLLPLLIHLINMMRHKRVEWAAMEFLLASYKKHRRWVWLKQLLLLLLRMLAVAAAVAMLARLVTQNEWSQLLGGQTTHHYVLLDDSLSMSDQSGGTSAFARAQQAVSQLLEVIEREGRQQKLTLIRYSRAAAAAKNGAPPTEDNEAASSDGGEGPDKVVAPTDSDTDNAATRIADVNAQLVSSSTVRQIDEATQALRPSQLAVSPAAGLELVEQLIRSATGDDAVLHVVSDFRDEDWSQPADLREGLKRIADNDTRLNLVRCAETPERNLAVVALEPEIGTRAAGVPLIVEFAVHNFSENAVTQLRVTAESTFYPTAPNGVESAGQTHQLPDLVIERIEPDETVRRQFQVYFPTAGEHHVKVQLPMDSVASDNQRWCVVGLQNGESALIVEGQPGNSGGYYLESIFRPGSGAQTGVIPVTQPLNYLRDADENELDRHHAIYLLDVPPLDTRSLENLAAYVRRGGGVAIYLGENYNRSFYNDWYEAGFFPLPVKGEAEYTPQSDADKADVVLNNHPLFAGLLGERNPFARAIRVSRYVATPTDWSPPSDSNISILATLGDASPLIAQRSLGQGRIVAFMTPVRPQWNNWALEPSFIVVLLQLHGHLAQPKRPSVDRRVGDPLRLQLDASEYLAEVAVTAPDRNANPARIFSIQAADDATGDSALREITLGMEPAFVNGLGETDTAGIYDLELSTLSNLPHHRRFAFNVSTSESKLDLRTRDELIESLDTLPVQVVDAANVNRLSDDQDRNSWSQFLLWLLIGVLLVEQFLAYQLSYHSPKATAEPMGGLS